MKFLKFVKKIRTNSFFYITSNYIVCACAFNTANTAVVNYFKNSWTSRSHRRPPRHREGWKRARKHSMLPVSNG